MRRSTHLHRRSLTYSGRSAFIMVASSRDRRHIAAGVEVLACISPCAPRRSETPCFEKINIRSVGVYTYFHVFQVEESMMQYTQWKFLGAVGACAGEMSPSRSGRLLFPR